MQESTQEGPIRILQVFSTMNRGGSENAIMNYYRSIDRKRIQFDFLVHTNDKCAFDDEINELGGFIYHIDKYKLYNHIKYVKLWKEFLRKHPQYYIIHGHFFTISAIYFSIARKFQRKCIAHSHQSGSLGKATLKHLIAKILVFPIRYLADYKYACSEEAARWLYGKKTVLRNDYTTMNNALDTSKFSFSADKRVKVRESLFISLDTFIVGHVGSFSFVKNHSFLIDIFKEINRKIPNSILILVGDGLLRKKIEVKVNEMQLNDSVRFLGLRSDVDSLLQCMDVLVFPSHSEGLPVTLIEAQAAGLPCLISDSIPDEVNITECISFLSLSESAKTWAIKALKLKEMKRLDTSLQIKSEGYDIKLNAIKLQEFYSSIYRNGR